MMICWWCLMSGMILRSMFSHLLLIIMFFNWNFVTFLLLWSLIITSSVNNSVLEFYSSFDVLADLSWFCLCFFYWFFCFIIVCLFSVLLWTYVYDVTSVTYYTSVDVFDDLSDIYVVSILLFLLTFLLL